MMLFLEALEALNEISELACPNDGFLDQVKFCQDLLATFWLKWCLHVVVAELLGDFSRFHGVYKHIHEGTHNC
jgi:hypothetical protein